MSCHVVGSYKQEISDDLHWIINNSLETDEEIKEYKEWLSSKNSHFLNCLLINFEMDIVMDKPRYKKLALRLDLAIQELNKTNQ